MRFIDYIDRISEEKGTLDDEGLARLSEVIREHAKKYPVQIIIARAPCITLQTEGRHKGKWVCSCGQSLGRMWKLYPVPCPQCGTTTRC